MRSRSSGEYGPTGENRNVRNLDSSPEPRRLQQRRAARLPAELVFRGRTLLGGRRLAGRRAESGTCDFNGLRRS
jgi:hypothetical protein